MIRGIRIFTVALALLVIEAGAKDKAEKEAIKAEKAAAKAVTAAKGTSAASSTKTEPPTKSTGFDAYKNVHGKNIFDPTRRGLRIETPTSTTSSSTSRGRSLALTGTMVTDGKALAFFGGSAAEGSRVISVGNSVANYKLTAIAPTQVSLEHEGKTITLDVGRQISFEGTSGDPAAAGPIVEAAHEPSAEVTGAPSIPGVAGDKADILRRMMERRAKEGGK
ncbi:MAG: hypothetical protein WCF18_20020 [Chthoniobacteraceae bacterium]